jgi:hypothetical protein
VVHRRSADEYDLRLEFLQSFGIVGERLSAQFFAALLQRFGTGIAKPEPPYAQRLQISRVAAANRSATDH